MVNCNTVANESQQEIRELHVRNPADIRINSDDRPNKRAENEQNIYRRHDVVLETELDRRKRKVKNDVECER